MSVGVTERTKYQGEVRFAGMDIDLVLSASDDICIVHNKDFPAPVRNILFLSQMRRVVFQFDDPSVRDFWPEFQVDEKFVCALQRADNIMMARIDQGELVGTQAVSIEVVGLAVLSRTLSDRFEKRKVMS